MRRLENVLAIVWVLAVLLASGLQVARNALQRSIMDSAGAWGATLVRFLFGVPFAVLFVMLAAPLNPGMHLSWNAEFWSTAIEGAAAQLLATTCLLISMRQAGFGVGTALQQSSLPLSAVVGWLVFHDTLSARSWFGVFVTTIGLAVLSWPRKEAPGDQPFAGGLFGLLSGLFFGFSLNAFRHASMSIEPTHPFFAALLSVAVVQAMQSVVLGLVLLICDRAVVRAVILSWRQSLAAGCCGTCASVAWFFALAVTPAVAVRAVGIVEAPFAALVGRRFFGEGLEIYQMLSGAAVIGGVLLTVLR